MNQFGSDAAHLLAPPREVTATLKAIARSIVPSRADFCFIHLAGRTYLRCVASAHATPAGERVVGELSRAYRIPRSDPDSTVAHVIRTGQPQLRSEIAPDPGAGDAKRIINFHRQLAPRSAIVVPVIVERQTVGALTLGYADSNRRYGSQHVAGATRLARRIAWYLVSDRRAAGMKPLGRTAVASSRRLPLRARV
jgi:GAF domain-containing protein